MKIDSNKAVIEGLQHEVVRLQNTAQKHLKENGALVEANETLRSSLKSAQDETVRIRNSFRLEQTQKEEQELRSGINNLRNTIQSRDNEVEELKLKVDFWKTQCNQHNCILNSEAGRKLQAEIDALNEGKVSLVKQSNDLKTVVSKLQPSEAILNSMKELVYRMAKSENIWNRLAATIFVTSVVDNVDNITNLAAFGIDPSQFEVYASWAKYMVANQSSPVIPTSGFRLKGVFFPLSTRYLAGGKVYGASTNPLDETSAPVQASLSPPKTPAQPTPQPPQPTPPEQTLLDSSDPNDAANANNGSNPASSIQHSNAPPSSNQPTASSNTAPNASATSTVASGAAQPLPSGVAPLASSSNPSPFASLGNAGGQPAAAPFGASSNPSPFAHLANAGGQSGSPSLFANLARTSSGQGTSAPTGSVLSNPSSFSNLANAGGQRASAPFASSSNAPALGSFNGATITASLIFNLGNSSSAPLSSCNNATLNGMSQGRLAFPFNTLGGSNGSNCFNTTSGFGNPSGSSGLNNLNDSSGFGNTSGFGSNNNGGGSGALKNPSNTPLRSDCRITFPR